MYQYRSISNISRLNESNILIFCYFVRTSKDIILLHVLQFPLIQMPDSVWGIFKAISFYFHLNHSITFTNPRICFVYLFLKLKLILQIKIICGKVLTLIVCTNQSRFDDSGKGFYASESQVIIVYQQNVLPLYIKHIK